MSVHQRLLSAATHYNLMSQDRPWRDEGTLRRLYDEEGKSAREISNELDCGKRTITNWLYRTGIKEPSGNEPYHDKERVEELYVEQGLSSEEIAERFDCSHLTVERWVTRHDLSGQRNKGGDKPWRDEERLRELYCGLGLTNREAGEILDCSGYCVSRWLKKKNIDVKDPKYRNWNEIKKIRNSDITIEEAAERLEAPAETIEGQLARYQSEILNDGIPSRHESPGTDKPWHDPDTLEEHFLNEDLSASEIAEEFGCSESTIHRWLRTFGIEANEEKPWTDEGLLRELYVEEDLTSEEIAEQVGCGHTTVLRWLKKYDVGQNDKQPLWQYKGILRTLYKENDWTIKEIGDELGAHKGTIRSWLRRHNIETPGRGGGKYQDPTVLRRMYKEKEMSVTDIADELECSHGTISYWLARHDIPTRTRDDVTHRFEDVEIEEEPPYENKQVLEQLFMEEEMSAIEISRELGFSEGVIRDRLHQFDLAPREEDEFNLEEMDYKVPEIFETEPWRDETLMRLLYVDHDLSSNDISEVLDCSSATVSTWLNEHDIETGGEINRPSTLELKKMYIDDRTSGGEISRKLEVSQSTVYRWLREADIDIRDPSDYTHPTLDNEEKLRELYIKEELSVEEMSRRLESRNDTVRRALENHGIEQRSRNAEISGEKHPFWKGGQEPYGKGWTKQKRKSVLERDDYTCQSCGLSQEEHIEDTGQGLHIHHIIPASEFEEPEDRNQKSNLVAMCSSCHKNWEGIPLRPHIFD